MLRSKGDFARGEVWLRPTQCWEEAAKRETICSKKERKSKPEHNSTNLPTIFERFLFSILSKSRSFFSSFYSNSFSYLISIPDHVPGPPLTTISVSEGFPTPRLMLVLGLIDL